jgi:signal transduction histidine kinase
MASGPHSEFARIASHLQKRREELLDRWRRAVSNDPSVGASVSLVRTQFVDHIPKILDAFDRALRARSAASEAAAEADELAGAAEHGEHRWLHGYDSRETLREWGHLHMCMLAELESFGLGDVGVSPPVMSEARTMLAQLFVDCMVESAASHAALERTAAEVRLSDLERVLEHLRTLERERTELWREAAHDLRGNVGAVKFAANALDHAVATPQLPTFVGLVRRSADSLDTLLNDLIELARLEAGREQRNVTRFSVNSELGTLCESLQPLADSRQLFLKFTAPGLLDVDGDAVKVRRIAQNLILNALKYTEKGGVLVTCEEVTPGDPREMNPREMNPREMNPGQVPRWVLRVQDTGAGLDAAALAGKPPALSSLAERRPPDHPSEGVGLSIVKRLCDLLDATLELQTGQGVGTTFRITFPRNYPP